MIPSYHIHQMLKPLEGGTTRPWLALVDDGDEWPKPYVVKFFHERDFKHANHLAAEVMGSILCGEFDISTPDFAFLRMPVITDANCSDELQERLRKSSYPKPWFGSASMLPAPEFSIALHDRYLPMDEMATIFAFDCLIHNSDRRPQKPNLLVKDGHIWAIDHDKGFANHNPKLGQVGNYARGHIFYKRLRKYCKKHGSDIFNTFAENLRSLNLKDWNAALDELEHLNLPFVHRNQWNAYLLNNKRTSEQFVSLLCELLK